MNIVNFFKYKLNALKFKFRAVVYFFFFKNINVQIHEGLVIRGGRGKNKFGKNLKILNNVIFEIFNDEAEIILGDDCFLSYGVIVVCTKKIKMGNSVWIGEYTSVRDSAHTFDKVTPISKLPSKSMEINIGSNVWIGRGSIILPGVTIGDNVIVAANSVVNKSIPTNCVYGGVPIKHIKDL